MAIDKKTIRLLILEDSQNEAERIVSLFRNAGHATRVYRISDIDTLEQALNSTWDLFIAAPTCKNLSPQKALEVLQKAARDTSFVQLIKENDSRVITEVLKRGAQDAVPVDEDEHLILVARRELLSLEARRAQRAAELALHEVEKRCQLLLDSSMDAICYVHDGMHIYANRTYLNLFGYADTNELEGMPMIDLIASQDQAGFKDFLKSYGTAKGETDFTFTGMTATGETFQASMNFSPAQYDGEPCIQVVIRTASENAELEEKLREASRIDPVTGLFNRQHFLELLDSAAERAVHAGEPASISYIILDNHDTLVSNIGISGIEALLTEFANVLRNNLTETTQIARFTDDAFAVIHPGSTPEQVEGELKQLIQKTEAKLFDIKGRTAQITLSIGAALLSEKMPKASQALENAHRCANKISNALKIHNPAEDIAAAASRGDVQAMILQALDSNSFRLLFQPIVSLRGNKQELYEVLIRLINAKGEEVMPADFLSAAINSNNGLAEKIDRWVLLNAIKQLTLHRTKGHNTRLLIHITSASLLDPSLLPWLSVALKASRLPPNSLVIQIRETDAVTYLRQAIKLVEGLHKLHCQAALVQFGCADNPFNTLKHLNVDFIKIDDSFTQEMNDTEQQEALQVLLSKLQTLKKQTIMPLVESATELSVLWQAGVTYIQGYYMQAPTPQMNYDFSSSEG